MTRRSKRRKRIVNFTVGAILAALHSSGGRQAERDEASLYVGRGRGMIARERLPFESETL